MANDRALAALIGLAAGDCLGAPVENRHPRSIAAEHGALRDFLYAAPIWTDDTQQALVLAESLVRHGAADPAWIGRRFVEMSHPRTNGHFGCHRGTGRGFREAVLAFETSSDWRRSGRPDRAGNGAAMRIAPVAVAVGDDDERLARTIADVSQLTHRESRAVAGALAVGWLAAQLAREPVYPIAPRRAQGLLEALVGWLREREAWLERTYPEIAPYDGDQHDISNGLAGLAERWDDGWRAAEEWIVAFAGARLRKPTFASAGYVLCSVPAAIALVLHERVSLEEAVVRAVNLGGDADTVGAMVGALAAAAGGLGEVPARWRSVAGCAELEDWGRALARAGEGVSQAEIAQLPDLVVLERHLCAQRWGH